MLRFFRQIRHRLLTDNKFSKYLLYAIGEILLVVIGILIALQIDNWNEERKNEEKVRTILSDLMDELVSDINKTTEIMEYYSLRDSAMYLILTDRVTKEDYDKGEIRFLNSVIDNYNRVDLTEKGFSILNQNLDIVPDEYKSIVKNLSSLYTINKKWVDQYDEEMGIFTGEIQNYYRENYSWFSGTSLSDWESRLEYKLNNFRYRNDVSEYRTLGVGNQLRFSIYYRKAAIKCYQEIAMLLNKPKYDESFVFNQEASEYLIGDWQVIGEPETKISLIKDGKRLYLKDNISEGRNEVFWLPPSKLILDNLLYGTLIKDKDGDLIKFNGFELKRAD